LNLGQGQLGKRKTRGFEEDEKKDECKKNKDQVVSSFEDRVSRSLLNINDLSS
jgi:hypothetical protein